jgi:hypothetical protein
MPVVTIARQLGSEGEEIAALVGARLGVPVLDAELLDLASERSGIPVVHLRALDERGRSVLRRPVDLWRLVPLAPINPDVPDVYGDRYPPTGPVVARGAGLVSPAYWAAEAYAALLTRTMRSVAATGRAVIVGRGGNMALMDRPDVLRALVVADESLRIGRIMAAERLDRFDARDRVRESDRNRATYTRQFFGANWLDPLRYDLVIDTDRMSSEAAADVISLAARSVVPDGTAADRPAATESVGAVAAG